MAGPGPRHAAATQYSSAADRSPAVPLHSLGARADDPDLWRELRARWGPVAPVETEPGIRAWLLLGYQENLEALRDRRRFSADTGSGTAPSADADGLPRARALSGDGADHARLRAPLTDALARIPAERVAAEVRGPALALIAAAAADGRIDLVGDYARPLPSLVLNRFFGLPDDYGRLLARLTFEADSGGDPARARTAAAALEEYFTGLVARRRAESGDDLASRVLAHPEALSDAEAAACLRLLWSAGHRPTAQLIGNALGLILGDARIGALYGQATLPSDDFLDYVMWTEPPLGALSGRRCTGDVRLGGAHLRPGDALVLGLAAAHADPAVTPGDRADGALALAGNRSHLMWGAGAHGCPAQGFAREIAGTAIDTLLERLPGLRAAGGSRPRRYRGTELQGPAELHAEFPAEQDTTVVGGRPPEAPRSGRRRRALPRPRPMGARYQAPQAAERPSPEAASVPVPRPAGARRPQGRGARYQAPDAAAPAAPDRLRALLDRWHVR
ncbi:cytochrome P450 family protein [Streptomonospora litoralis]|uniref:Cytochrome P450 107B1 n=1 Tax=Streptomonospora litoralis TaxID=2498135 RepID=A0A4P6Q100_9ACTN|nr:cytochrome P450 [Streptomonospora litoralis]QBI54185.1 Cytochrome P450 107B1 [Streptomonospora litoralis]